MKKIRLSRCCVPFSCRDCHINSCKIPFIGDKCVVIERPTIICNYFLRVHKRSAGYITERARDHNNIMFHWWEKKKNNQQKKSRVICVIRLQDNRCLSYDSRYTRRNANINHFVYNYYAYITN